MRVGFGRAVERAVELLGWVVLLVLLIALMWCLGLIVWLYMGELLLGRSIGSNEIKFKWPGVELVIVPLAAIAAARLRFGADRVLALRASRVGPMFPLLMAASLLGLLSFVVWTWVTPWTVFGAQPDFGVLRWLGIVLAAGFTWLWMPLFPRITATLAGLFAGPALVAIIAYPFMGSCVSIYEHLHDSKHRGHWLFAIFLTCYRNDRMGHSGATLSEPIGRRLGIVVHACDGRPMSLRGLEWRESCWVMALFGTLVFTA